MREKRVYELEEMKSNANFWRALEKHIFIDMVIIIFPMLFIAFLVPNTATGIRACIVMIAVVVGAILVPQVLAPKRRRYWECEISRLERQLEHQKEKEKEKARAQEIIDEKKRKEDELSRSMFEVEVIEKAKLTLESEDFLNDDMMSDIGSLSSCSAIYDYFYTLKIDDPRYELILNNLESMKQVERWYGNKKVDAITMISKYR